MSNPNINLLPNALAPKSSFIKLARNLKMVSMVVFIILVVVSSVAVASFYLLTSQIKDMSTQETDLKTSIKALEETEQRLILVQDRLAKAEIALNQEKVGEEIEVFKNFVSDLPDGVSYGEASLDPGSVTITISAADSERLAELFSQIYISESFSKVVLSGLNFNSERGYGANLKLVL